MNRRAYSVMTGTSVVLIAALVAAPVWDFWHYRIARSRSRSPFPIAVIAPPTRWMEPIPLPTPPVSDSAGGTHGTETAHVPLERGLVSPASHGRESAVGQSSLVARVTPRTPPSDSIVHPSADDRPASEHRPASGHRPAVEEAKLPEERQEKSDASAEKNQTPGLILLVAATPEGSSEPPLPILPFEGPPPTPHTPPPPNNKDPRPDPHTTPLVRLLPDRTVLSPGETVTIAVQVQGASSLSSLPFHLLFDPTILIFIDSEVGAALASPFAPVLLASVHPSRPGDLAVGLSLLPSGGFFSGTGSLVLLRFQALARGESALEFDRASLRGALSEPLPAQFEDSAVSVQ